MRKNSDKSLLFTPGLCICRSCGYKKKAVWELIFWIGMIAAGGVFAFIWLAATGNGDQVYTDVVYENVSAHQSNKSPERVLLYVLIFAGIILYTVYTLYSTVRNNAAGCCYRYTETKKRKKYAEDTCIQGVSEFLGKTIAAAFSVMAGTWYFFYTGISPMIFITAVYAVFLLLVHKDTVLEGMVFFFSAIYAIVALYRCYVFLGGLGSISIAFAGISAFIMSVLLSAGENRRMYLIRGTIAVQVLIPFLLLALLQDTYRVGEEYVTVEIPFRAKAVVAVLLGVFIIEACRLLKEFGRTKDIRSAVTRGSCISIMAFHMSGGTGVVVPEDLHHTFENIIGYSQIFEKGLMPYDGYISASGFYSVVQGAFFRFFGDGLYANYYLTNNLFYLFISLIVVLLLCLHLKKSDILFLSLILDFMGYNRVVFVLPAMLLLTYPKWIDKKNLWLRMWFLTSFVLGIYYPVYGAAVCMAFLPLGIWQVWQLTASGELKRMCRKASFWAGWAVCLFPAVLCREVLWGTLCHVKAMAGQTIYADGIARFAQCIPDTFMPYLPGLRLVAFYVLTFLIPALAVWAGFALAVKAAGITMAEKKFKIENKKAALAALSLALALCVMYSYTIVRLDAGNLYNRNGYLFPVVTVMLIVLASQYVSDCRLRRALVCFAVFLPAVQGSFAFHNMDAKLSAYHIVPDGYVHTEDDPVEWWGNAYVEPGLYASVEEAYTRTAEDRERTCFGTLPNFGYYYLCGLKPVSVMEMGLTVKGYEAARESMEVLKEYPSIVGGYGDTFSTSYAFSNYYLYHWLVTSGEYVWSSEKDVFLPNTNSLSKEEVHDVNKDIAGASEDFDMGLNCSSMGSSMKSLECIFREADSGYAVRTDGDTCQIDFEQPLDGEDVDHLYLEFEGMDQNYDYILDYGDGTAVQASFLSRYLLKKRYNHGMAIAVQWADDQGEVHRIRCSMSKGKLLIPLGSGRRWLLHAHSALTIWAEQDGERMSLPDFVDIKFLKLREIDS